jgi:hypothetical protein
MIDVPSNQPFIGSFPWPEFEALYRDVMDASFLDIDGPVRKITLHLTPVRTQSSGLVDANVPNKRPIQYNPYLGRAARPAPISISSTRTPAVQHIPRDVKYDAHIRHGIRTDVTEDVGIELKANQVATTTIIESGAHIGEAESATIDGRRYRLHAGPRPIGFRSTRYLISIWEQIPEGEDVG